MRLLTSQMRFPDGSSLFDRSPLADSTLTEVHRPSQRKGTRNGCARLRHGSNDERPDFSLQTKPDKGHAHCTCYKDRGYTSRKSHTSYHYPRSRRACAAHRGGYRAECFRTALTLRKRVAVSASQPARNNAFFSLFLFLQPWLFCLTHHTGRMNPRPWSLGANRWRPPC